MDRIKTYLRSLLAILILSVPVADSQTLGNKTIDSNCTYCICIEGCAITKDFWLAAGQIVRDGDEFVGPDLAFENCQDSFECSAKVIRKYMKQFRRDCNGDGIIDCYDYAAIHRVGPDACELKHLPQHYLGQIQNCLHPLTIGTSRRMPNQNMSISSKCCIRPFWPVPYIFVLLLFGFI